MLRRKVFDHLVKWKSNPNHKSLVIKGQRQVGKTFIIREFGKTYQNFIELNFLEKPSLKEIFNDDLDTDSIISKMKLYFDPELFVPAETLLFFDEIQECGAARTSLKFFTEDGRYDVICSGSRLGIEDLCSKTDRPCSIPVGYEEQILMNGLDFEEFLWAMEVSEETIDTVKKKIHDKKKIPSAYNSVFSSHFRDYMIVGGMPESVQKYKDTKDYTESLKIIADLVESAKADINKYNTGVNRIKTAECYDSIPYQLGQTNKKFMYSRITGEGSRKSAEKYMDNLLWIKSAGYGNFCYAMYSLEKPLSRFRDNSSFRVYMSDTGTLTYLYGTSAAKAILNSDYKCNVGAIAENAVAECLVKSDINICYYRKSNGTGRMELDFITEYEGEIIVIEVKSGKDRDAPSITNLKDETVARRIMFGEENIQINSDGLECYPMFAAAFIRSIL